MSARKGVTHAEAVAKAVIVRQRIVAFLTERGSISVREMGDELGVPAQTLRDYLFRMAAAGIVTSVLEIGYKGAPTAAIYSLGTGGATKKGSCESPHRPVRKTYPLYHVRDALVAALFGPAKP